MIPEQPAGEELLDQLKTDFELYKTLVREFCEPSSSSQTQSALLSEEDSLAFPEADSMSQAKELDSDSAEDAELALAVLQREKRILQNIVHLRGLGVPPPRAAFHVLFLNYPDGGFQSPYVSRVEPPGLQQKEEVEVFDHLSRESDALEKRKSFRLAFDM